MATITTDVEVYLDDFDDQDILEAAYDIMDSYLRMNRIRKRDEEMVEKFRRLFTGLEWDEYAPSSAYYIKSEDELKSWIAKQ